MAYRTFACLVAVALLLPHASNDVLAQTEKWNNPGRGQLPPDKQKPEPAARRDLAGVWDSGRMGVNGLGMAGAASPLTPRGEQLAKENRATVGPRLVSIGDANDPVATYGDPAGFPRNNLFENRVIQILQTANQVIVLYQFEKRWRVIWTDGRAFPENPDPRYYGYSVGKWEDEYTLVVETVGLDERTWLENSGLPHSADLRVIERFHRVDSHTLDIAVEIIDPAVYTKPWKACFTTNPAIPCGPNLRFLAMSPDTDMLEWVPSASEAAEYRRLIAEPNKR